MRKLDSLLLCCLLALGIAIAGCGSEAPKTGGETPPAVVEAPPADSEAAPAAAAKTVTLYRTEYGVPHIYADTAEAAAYALGYAQAEDRLEDIYINVRMALGTMAEAFGPKHVDRDYLMQLFRNAKTYEDAWNTVPAHVRVLGDSFIQGVNAYVAEHPERKPEYALELHGWHSGAVGQAMIFNWPIGTVMGDYRNREKREAPAQGSNGWVVGPGRSADDCAILLTDPHLTWEGMAVFYEARVKGGDLDVNGYFLVGSPLMALGHSANVAWACTTGGPDTSDVYELKLNPANPMQYEYDGEWLDAEVGTISVKVKGEEPVERMAAYTILGPVVGPPDVENHLAYAGATPYYENTDLYTQMYAMNTAKNTDEFYEALGMNAFMEQNLLFADRAGNIQYVRSGRVPIRPDGYDWNRPVPGHTSATKWLGIHDIADLVQVKNPPQGYFQNCNIAPSFIMPDSPLTPDKYKPYIYNVSWDKRNQRGIRARQLLDGDDSITKEEAKAFGMDVYDVLATRWQAALKTAVAAVGQGRLEEPAFAKAVEDILAWDGQYTCDSVAAAVFKFWRIKCEPKIDVMAIAKEEAISEVDQVAMLMLLAETLGEMKELYGKTDPAWGDMHVVGRGDKFFPCAGAQYCRGPEKVNQSETLRDIGYGEGPAGPGKYVARKGSGSMILTFLHKDYVESFSCVPWGQSGRPESPHYTDQAEKIYGKRIFKPTLFNKEDLLKTAPSEEVLSLQ